MGEPRVPAVTVADGAAADDAPLSTPPELLAMAAALALAAALCAAGFWCEARSGLRGSGILFLTAFTVVLATAMPRATARLHGAADLGTLLMHVFFAVIGASANIATVVRVGPVLFVFAGLILTVHLLVILLAGRVLGLDLAEVVIASNANLGGPTTAAAMAVARRWRALVIPAILCGTLGYATDTFLGVAVGHFLH